MKDKLIGVGLIVGLAMVIALISWVGHRVGDPVFIPQIVTTLVAAMGLVIMWLKQAPQDAPKTIDEVVTKAVVDSVEKAVPVLEKEVSK